MRALAWLGAKVIIAEIDVSNGKAAAGRIARDLGEGRSIFIQTDVGDERSVSNLAKQVYKIHGRADIILNNAAIEPIGAVNDSPIEDWDSSYRVNLRGPVLLARAFLPRMLRQKQGVFVCVSSVGGAFMAPYEAFITAQVELANTIHAECERTGVAAFTIGPGLVPETPGAQKGIQKVARMLNKTIEEFKDISKTALISAEAAGAGFAATIALASKFSGQEISSKWALKAAGIELPEERQERTAETLSEKELGEAFLLCREIRKTLAKRNEEWKEIGLFQRKWMFRDFSKRAGLPLEEFLILLGQLENDLIAHKNEDMLEIRAKIEQLSQYYGHMQELTKGFVKDQKVLKEQLQLQRKWRDDAQRLAAFLG